MQAIANTSSRLLLVLLDNTNTDLAARLAPQMDARPKMTTPGATIILVLVLVLLIHEAMSEDYCFLWMRHLATLREPFTGVCLAPH